MMCPQSMEDVQCSVSENSQVCIWSKTWQKWKPAPLLFPGWDTLGDMFAGMVCLSWHGVIVSETYCTTFRTFHPLHQYLGQEQWPWFSLCAFLCCKTCEPLKACHWLSYDSSLATNDAGANSFQVPSVIYGIYASVLSLIFTSLHTVCNMFPMCAHKGAFPATCPLNLSMSLSIG